MSVEGNIRYLDELQSMPIDKISKVDFYNLFRWARIGAIKEARDLELGINNPEAEY